jgi:hypothetical protein
MAGLRFRTLALAACLVLAPCAASAQAPGTPPRLRVFLDCGMCDETYLRQQVQFIDYVREPAAADVHVFTRTEDTGSGGLAWTMSFLGRRAREGHDHVVRFTTPETATSDDRRRTAARYFALGLAAFAADTSVAPQLDVVWRQPAAEPSEPPHDPWHAWVFRVNFSGYASGESLNRSRSYRASFSGNRTTEQWKVTFSAAGNLNENEFDLEDADTIRSRSESWSASTMLVKSLGSRLSVGARSAAARSSFSNIDRSLTLEPGVELNVFAYRDWSRRNLTAFYTVGGTAYEYRELTVFDRLREAVPHHALSVNLALRQPWGSLELYSTITQQLQRRERYRASFVGSTDVRLFRGFSLNVFAEYSLINDQTSLQKGTATPEEVLLRLRQLATTYSYSVSVGFGYSFGSIFNNVVNPRFGG